MTKRLLLLVFCLVIGFSGCATATLSPGATLLSGLSQYQGEMRSLGGSTARWPERQRAGSTLKLIVTATIGGSAEFYRLIDLDVKKREFIIAMRETAVGAGRLQDMKRELAQMNDEIAALKPVIRTQLAALRLQSDPEQPIEEAAVRGLLRLALDAFSANGIRYGLKAPSTRVGRFVVTDLGAFATVENPDGRIFRCIIFGVAEEGAGIKCDPAN